MPIRSLGAAGLAALGLLAFTILPSALAGQSPPLGAIAGRVVTGDATPVPHAVVHVVELSRRTEVDHEGRFRFAGVPPGSYLLTVDSERHGRGIGRVDVAAGETVEIDLVPLREGHSEAIVVSAGADPRSLLEVAQPTTVLEGEALRSRLAMTLGETLAAEPGVATTYFGPGASRPVIRGLGGERVRTLTDGLGSADASATSPDHGVALEPMAAERIEIVRGPAALLYGGNAVGGVVNAVDGRIPDYLPADGAHGTLDVALGTAADERSVSASADGGLGPSVAWHVDVSSRETDDVEIPGLPAEEADHAGEGEDDPDEEVFRGVLENSSIEATNGSVGLSWIGTDGFLGVSLSGFESDYGVPGHGHGHGEHGEAPAGGEEDGHEEDEDAAVRIDLEQRRLDLAGQWNGGLGPFRGVRVRAGASEYEHAELEGDEVGTRFTNDAIEARVDLVQRRRGSLEGSVGVQASRVDFGAFGEEAFVTPSLTTNVALFTLQEISRGPLSFQLGGRIERQEVDPEGRTSPRSFTVSSASAGAIWAPFEGLTVGGSLSRSERAPTSTELFAFGPHAATRAFEIGDPDLDAEVALGTDLSIRGRLDRFAGSVSVFYNRFDGYIYESFTGETEDGLDVIRFEQRDADLFGLEAEARFELVELPGGHLEVFGEGDLVRAELRRSGDPLPRIPPARLSAGFDLHHERWGGSVAVRRVFEQDRIAANEDTTPAYTLVDASLSYRLFARQAVIDLVLRGTNLTDELALVHTSFLKNEAPLPGRDFRLAVRVAF